MGFVSNLKNIYFLVEIIKDDTKNRINVMTFISNGGYWIQNFTKSMQL